MNLKIRIVWNFKPIDFLKKEFSIEHEGFKIHFKIGRIEAIGDKNLYIKMPDIQQKIYRKIESYFDSTSLECFTSYDLDEPYTYEISPEGHIVNTKVPPSKGGMITSGGADYIVINDGTIIFDSKEEDFEKRIKYAQSLYSLQEKHPILKQMVKSYKNAISDPNNEFFHLYEIREALEKDIGKNKKYFREKLKQLKLYPEEWVQFRETTNNSNIKQGRHRGQRKNELRSATQEEIDMVRSHAKKLIEFYINFLKEG